MTTDPDELEELRERDSLADAIATAFAPVPRPERPVARGVGPMPEDVERALGGKSAGEVTAGDARAVRVDLGYLTPPAFVYYLPALLRVALAGGEQAEGVGESLFGMLAPPQDPELRAAFDRRVAGLDGAQRDALARWMRWYAGSESDLPGRERALAYWREGEHGT